MQTDLNERPKIAKNGAGEIPTPVSTRWREFRVRFLPIMVVGVCGFFVWKLWTDMPSATAIRGIGEGQVSIIASPHDGFVELVAVPQRGLAKAGEELLTIQPYDPAARMEMLQSQLQISRLALEPTLTDRNAVNFEQLRIEALRLRGELVTAQANLAMVERVLPRHKLMAEDKLITQDLFDATLRNRDVYQGQVKELTSTLAEIESRLKDLSRFSEGEQSSTNSLLSDLLPRFEAQLQAAQTNWNAVTLIAPISGEVNYFRNVHEFVRAGEQLVMINSDRAERVVAYVKQPMTFDPEVGMPMRVTTRNRNRISFDTYVAQMGARVEVITNALAYIAPGAIVDSGLPLILPVPDNVHIRPGEVVDVELLEGEKKVPASKTAAVK